MPDQGTAAVSPDLLQEENRKLRRAVEELSILNDLARAIGALHNTQEIIQTIIRRSLRAIQGEQGVITLVEREADQSMRTLVRTMASSSDHEQFHFNQTLLGWMHLNKKPLIINDPKRDERFRGVQWDESIRSLLSVPMMIKSELLGVITLYNKKGGRPFTEEDQRLLAIIAGQSAQVVENARLYEQEQALLRVQEEIRLASKIQTELLPKAPPRIPGYEIAGCTISALDVGGDYYDFIPKDDRRWAICLGDVSGKGLSAAMLMANLQATLRSQTLVTSSPKICLENSNRLLYQSTSPEKFATLFYGVLDLQRNALLFSNAGHNDPFLISPEGRIRRLKTGGIPLAMLGEFPFEEEDAEVAPGDVLLIYSDGVSEAMNERDDFFGDDAVLEIATKRRGDSAEELINAIVAAVKEHAGSRPQADDITLVVVRRMPL